MITRTCGLSVDWSGAWRFGGGPQAGDEDAIRDRPGVEVAHEAVVVLPRSRSGRRRGSGCFRRASPGGAEFWGGGPEDGGEAAALEFRGAAVLRFTPWSIQGFRSPPRISAQTSPRFTMHPMSCSANKNWVNRTSPGAGAPSPRPTCLPRGPPEGWSMSWRSPKADPRRRSGRSSGRSNWSTVRVGGTGGYPERGVGSSSIRRPTNGMPGVQEEFQEGPAERKEFLREVREHRR